MTWLLWIGGAVVLIGAAVAPALVARRRTVDAAVQNDLGRARDLMSRLDFELDRARSDHPGRAEAERCQLLAGAALAGDLDHGDAGRAASWASAGLDALGVRPPGG